MTYTYVLMEISKSAYNEIAGKLRSAGYNQAFHLSDSRGDVVLDMHGIALAVESDTDRLQREHEQRAAKNLKAIQDREGV